MHFRKHLNGTWDIGTLGQWDNGTNGILFHTLIHPLPDFNSSSSRL